MARKPDIQYVGQFYNYGSEAKKLAQEPEKKKAKTRLPLERLQNIPRIYVDPVAIAGIVVAFALLAAMVFGTVQVNDAWQEYQTMASYVHSVKADHAQLRHTYQMGYNLSEIENQALMMGYVPASELESVPLEVTPSRSERESNVFVQAWNDMIWFLHGLFA